MDEAEIHQRHKEEQKELNVQIQALKHSVPKGDKKKKKEVAGEIALLTAQLEQQQANELAGLGSTAINGASDGDGDCEISNEVAELNIKEDENTSTQCKAPQQRVSKAQRRREKKEAEERARQKRIEDGESEGTTHSRNIEAAMFDKILKEKGLTIVDINPDGNCMYNAVVVTLHGTTSEEHLKALREKTCDYMLENTDEYLPFTLNNTTGDMLSPEEYQGYCNDIKETNSWGGHVELRAISQIHQMPIEVYQAQAPTLLIGEEFQSNPVRLSYHRHQYGLGEHYNALLPRT